MKKILLLFFAIIVSVAASARNTMVVQDYNVVYQRLEIKVNPEVYYISGCVTTYFKPLVTDFNTIAREANDKIDIVWEYIPGAKYKLVYNEKDAKTKEEVDAVNGAGVGAKTIRLNENNIQTITENGIKKVYLFFL